MDWSRCCNSLTQYDDGVYQVGVFERMLRKNHYYSTEYEGPARATICTWEETEAWLKEVAAKEQVEKEEMAGEKMKKEEAKGSGKENATNRSTPPQLPRLFTTKVHRIAQEPKAGKEKVTVESPRSPNTFPDLPKVGHNSPGHGRKSKTGSVPLRKRVSLPQMLQLFHRKIPPAPLIKNED